MRVENLESALLAIADHLQGRRDFILQSWHESIKADPALTTGSSLPRVQLLDHIPEVLLAFDTQLRAATVVKPNSDAAAAAVHQPAAAHGLLRWQQGYNLHEVTRELGKLNETMLSELGRYVSAHSSIPATAVSRVYGIWAVLCTSGVEESVGQYFTLRQAEAAGHVKDLESALVEIQASEEQRADLWQQAAHDLRGNLGVVANATVGLTNTSLPEVTRDKFTRMLMRNVTSLHHLLDDVTSLARLQAGREQRSIQPIDVTPILRQLCEGVGEMAKQRQLFLRCEGPAGFGVDGDAVKIRRIAQNLVLNAVKYTHAGGIHVSWGDSEAGDSKRWALTVKDTGPGFPSASGKPLANAIESASQLSQDKPQPPPAGSYELRNIVQERRDAPGEGIGLSIVKRLCELLDATIEVESIPDVGTTFRVLFPRTYSQ
jgi:signal transduction histidine kinase